MNVVVPHAAPLANARVDAGAPPCMLLDVRGLRATRGDIVVLEGVDLVLDRGRALVVTGPNGSGKTTLLRIVAGLAAPDAGTVAVHGVRAGAHAQSLRETVAYIGHAPGLKDALTAAENVRALAKLHGHAPTRDAIVAALDALGIAERRQVAARSLSQGERRRVALARLLVAPRTLWVLDEPTTALDRGGVTVLADMLSRHLARGGAALIAAHEHFDIAGTGARRLALA